MKKFKTVTTITPSRNIQRRKAKALFSTREIYGYPEKFLVAVKYKKTGEVSIFQFPNKNKQESFVKKMRSKKQYIEKYEVIKTISNNGVSS